MKIIDLKDKFPDKNKNLGFCIGAGPSLAYQDVKPLRDYITIAANSGILKDPKHFTGYLSDDWSVKDWQYHYDIAKHHQLYKFLYRSKLEKYSSHFKPEEIIFFEHKCWYNPKTKEYPEDGLDITEDEPIIGARSSLGSCVHTLYILGIRNIVLLGADCAYDKKTGKRYFWEITGPFAKRRENKPISWHAYKKVNGYSTDHHGVETLEYWRQLAEVIKTRGPKDINIIDCSDGLLNCFPKMTLEKVLEEYGDKK